LSLLVLTSDDAEFAIATSQPVTSADSTVITEAYQQAAAGHTGQPALLLCFAPFILNIVGGDFFVNALDAASGGVPIFGSLASDNTIDYHKSAVLIAGEAYVDRMACVLIYATLQPQFYLGTISSKKMADAEGVVTSCENNIIKEVDGRPLAEFLHRNGLNAGPDGQIETLYNFPLYADNHDGTPPVARLLLKLTPQGHAICGGEVDAGATVSVGYLDEDEVLSTTQHKLSELQLDNASAVLCFSCIGRYFALGYGYDGETDAVHASLDQFGPVFNFAYSAGEICPLPGKDGSDALFNRFHNSTFIALVL